MTTKSTSPTTEAPASISVRGVHKNFGNVQAVRGIDLEIPAGQIVALLGVNGAGKTTLIDMVIGFQAPTSGTTSLFGMTPRAAIRRGLVGVVHQTGALLPEYTVAQTLKLFAATHDHPLDLDELLERTDLTDLAKRRVGKLSGGEQQRVRLALALLPDPQLLILDEPTAGMDAVARRRFWELMRHQADAGRTIVFATHYLAEAQDFAERTIIMTGGRIIRDGATDDIRRQATRSHLRIQVPSIRIDEAETALTGLAGSGTWEVAWKLDEDGAHGGHGVHGSNSRPSTHGGHREHHSNGGDGPNTAHGVHTAGERTLTITGRNLDDAARTLLNIDGTHGLELNAATLEDAFSALVQPQE